MHSMTERLERAIAKAKSLPPARQDEVAAMLLDLVEQDRSQLQLSEAQQAEVRRRLSAETVFVSAEDMGAFFRDLT